MSAPSTYFIDIAIHGDLRDNFTLAQVLSAIHSTNRKTRQLTSNSYPLGISFPYWIDPKFHATKMLGFGSTGPVIRVLSESKSTLQSFSESSVLLRLHSIGDSSATSIDAVPTQISYWASFQRASDAESLSPSHIKRLEKRAMSRGEASIQNRTKTEGPDLRKVGYLKVPLKSESTNQSFMRSVRRIKFAEVGKNGFDFDSWGLSKPNCRIPMF
jgi:CRISPR-associated endoribonuclease Cas6/Csy4 subtype I-F